MKIMQGSNFEKIMKDRRSKGFTQEDMVARKKTNKPNRNNYKRKY